MGWSYDFSDPPTMNLNKPAALCSGKQWPLVAGVDGRTEGGVKRYPGHLRYSDTGLSPGSLYGIHRRVEFNIQKQVGSDERISGFAVSEQAAGEVNLFYHATDNSSSGFSFYSPATLPTGVPANAWWMAPRGRFLYFVSDYAASVSHKTIFWDKAYSTFRARTFGPGDVTLSSGRIEAPTLTEAVTGTLLDRKYQVCFRYRDTARARYSPLSNPTSIDMSAAGKKIQVDLTTSAGWAPHVALSTATVASYGSMSTTAIKLDAAEPATTDALVGKTLRITHGADTEDRLITAWNGTTKVATTVAFTWTPSAGDAYTVRELLYDKVQVFCTVGSSDQAGGTAYLVAEGAVQTGGYPLVTSVNMGSWQVFIGEGSPAIAADDGYGLIKTPFTDADFVLRPAYDVLGSEEINNVSSQNVLGIAHYQGVSFIAYSHQQAFIDIMWSNPNRLEPENFPTANTFTTRIPVSAKWTIRFVQCSDYLYLLGGDRIYKIQRQGVNIRVTEVARGIPLLMAESVVAVSQTLIIPTSKGIMMLDGRSSALTPMIPSQWWFARRWRSCQSPVSAHADGGYCMGLYSAYDARMDCVYILAPLLDECLCLWLGTGRVTMLVDCRYRMVGSAESLAYDTDGTTLDPQQRAFFWTSYKWATIPNWADRWIGVDPSYRTMHGLNPSSGDLNIIVSSITRNTPTGKTTLTCTHNLGTSVSVVGATLRPLSGVNANQTWIITAQTSTTLVVSGVWAVETGGTEANVLTIALSPVTMALVGPPLSDGSGRLNAMTRKRTTAVHVIGPTPDAGGSQTDNQAAGQSSVASYFAWGLFKAGVLRDLDMQNWSAFAQPAYLPTMAVSKNGPTSPGTGNPGAAWKPAYEAPNTVKLQSAFSSVLPALYFLTSNLDVELYQWVVDGGLDSRQSVVTT